MCDVTRDTPVRKLRFSTLRALSDQLDPLENWRSVMMDISGTSGEPIYSQLHIRCRNNIRIVGLPESLEGPRPSVFFAQVLADILGEEILPSPLAHRALISKPATGKKPRPVIIRLHRYRQKELII
ncbi:unnamed protein product [Leuciscus chuanchicus]